MSVVEFNNIHRAIKLGVVPSHIKLNEIGAFFSN